MPTERFLNLSAEKRQRVMQAARQEAARATNGDISINKIIKAADIPRGSFYQYFHDKADLIECIMEDYNRGLHECAMQSFAKNNGDLFAAYIDVFDYTLEYAAQPDNTAICCNIFGNNLVEFSKPLQFLHQLESMGVLDELAQKVNQSRFRYTSMDDWADILGILITVFRDAIISIFLGDSDPGEERRSFINKVSIIKNGIFKEGTI